MLRYRRATASLSLLALALAGCNKSAQDMTAATSSPSPNASPDSGLPALPAALPMQTGPASSLTPAPPVAALPVRRAIGLARPPAEREAYAYLDRASDVQDEIGDAPPDYDYRNDDGVSPWVWQTHGGDRRYAEPSSDGYRYYYYQPGAQYPYLVRTHDYSYAYAGAALVAIYALSGALVSPDRYDGYRDQASRYFWRGQQLRQASDQREHRGVNAANWAAQRAQFSAAQANWAADRAQQAEWQAYHAQNDPSQRPGWQQEHQRRQQVAQQFSGWQSRGLEGPPPPALAGGVGRSAGYHQPDAYPRQPDNGGRQPDRAGLNGTVTGEPGQHGLGRPNPAQGQDHQRRDGGSPQGGFAPGDQNPNKAVQAAAGRDRQLATEQEARRQAQASQTNTQETRAIQHQPETRQPITDHAHQQRKLQQGEPPQRDAPHRDTQISAHQPGRPSATPRQAETRRIEGNETRPPMSVHEHPQPGAAAHEHAAEAKRPPAPHADTPHPGHRPEPGHEADHHE